MKVAISATSGSLDAEVDPRFGRCAYFVLVDSESMQFDVVPNTAAGATGGAGIQAAQLIANKGANVVITGNIGPNAFQALSSARIDIVTGASGTVRESVEKFKSGQLQKITAPTSSMGFGTGGGYGMGAGRGRGGGRGMGMRRWQPMQPLAPQAPVSTPVTPSIPPKMSKEQEMKMLEAQIETVQKQLEQIKKRLNELKK